VCGTLGDGATRDERGTSGCWCDLKSSSDDTGNFIESLLSVSEIGEVSSMKLLREEERTGERSRGTAKVSHCWESRGECLRAVRAAGRRGERGASFEEALWRTGGTPLRETAASEMPFSS